MATAADEETAPLLATESSGNAPSSPSLSSRLSTALTSPRSLNGLEKLLAALAVFLLLLTATFAGLFAGEAVKLGEEKHHGRKHGGATVTATSTVSGPTATVTASPLPHLPGKNGETCLTPTCVTVAATVLNALDTTVDPCDNFYQFANGGWLDSHPIPDGAGMFGSAQDIGVRNKRIILEVLDRPVDHSLPEADQTNLANLRSFWSSCLDEDRIDRQGLDPLLDVVQEVVGAWRGEAKKYEQEEFVEQQGQLAWNTEMLKSKKKSKKLDPKTKKERLTNALMYLHSRAIPALFEIFVDGDVKRSPHDLVAWITQSGLGLPSKDYYDDKEALDVYEEIIRASLKSIYAAREETTVDAKELAKAVLDFELKLAKISIDPETIEDPQYSYNPHNASALQSLFPSISFPNYFASYTPRPSYPDPVIVTAPDYLKNLTKLLEDVEPETLEGYFVFRTAQAYGPLLGSKQTVRKEISWLNNFLGGVPEGTKEPRSDVCLASLQENFGFLIGRYYVQKAFAGDSKEYAEDIIVATIQAFKDRLPELDWLDAETRKLAEEKADAITHKIGYPTVPNTEDPLSLQRYYALNLPVSQDDYFGNVLRSRLADQRRMWVQVGRQMDKGMWDMIPSEVNAYYSPPANEIAFPAGILQSPYFSKDWPEFLAFGAFGSVAGHELSHAFDQAGRQYDKNGKLVDWWTKNTTRNFETLQKCIIDQYANYTILDASGKEYYVQSKMTNGEDMADAGGLAQSFRAWSDRFDSDKEGKKYDNYLLPGLGYSREQLFFIAYAQGWARNIKPAEAVKRIRTDPHSPTNYRVIGPLSNNPDFAKAFNCPAGSPMNNVEKCKVW
ncbi:hypothetical protein BCR35DRAFT_355234 [Leucosporidium creatinivorum]|uniref:Endothelin-converting enzyme 1 n=1 Tax=Leucosporidium creatinivorum TaxID=106004 RepID=A0A1Y2DM87_9BASI|nr:hypothetical protein BCR35DRAFT_355234 [Leucosporidium creatinivorum]